MSELGKVIEELDPKAKYPDESVLHIRCGELRTLIAAAKRAEQAEAEVGRLRGMAEWKRGEEHESMMEIWSRDAVVRVLFTGMHGYERVRQAKDALARAFGVWPYQDATPPPTANEGATA